MDHCQDDALTHDAAMNEGIMSTRLGLRGWPNAAEDLIVSRNVILSTYTGAHIHLQHISSKYSVEIIRRAKARGLRITAEATPHHIAFTDDALATYDTNFKMNPPLRTEADRQEILAGLRDGTLDCISTDHAPTRSTTRTASSTSHPLASSASKPRFPSVSPSSSARTNSNSLTSST